MTAEDDATAATSVGVRWQRLATYLHDPDVSEAYVRLLKRGQVCCDSKLVGPLARRAAEDGHAVAVDATAYQYSLAKNVTIFLHGPLSAEQAEPASVIRQEAAACYVRLLAGETVWRSWAYAQNALLAGSIDGCFFAELDHLAAEDGHKIVCDRLDDIGDEITLRRGS